THAGYLQFRSDFQRRQAKVLDGITEGTGHYLDKFACTCSALVVHLKFLDLASLIEAYDLDVLPAYVYDCSAQWKHGPGPFCKGLYLGYCLYVRVDFQKMPTVTRGYYAVGRGLLQKPFAPVKGVKGGFHLPDFDNFFPI